MNRFKGLGIRTDILATSIPLKETAILNACHGQPKFLFYMSDKKDMLNDYLKNTSTFYPDHDREILNAALGSRPSTGCMLIDFIHKSVNFKSLRIYGFDFMKTPNAVHGHNRPGPHNFKREKEYIMKIVNSEKKIKLL